MAFRVEIAEPAELDINEAALYIASDSPSAAFRWNTELWQLILSLREMPAWFSVIEEAEELGVPYRSALHFSHRVIFTIDEPANTVYVVRVYHGARRPLTHKDL